MYLHLFCNSDGSVLYILNSKTKSKKDGLTMLAKYLKRKYGAKIVNAQLDSPPEWKERRHKVVKLNDKRKLIY